MPKSARLKAEEQFAAIQKNYKRDLKEKEKGQREKTEHVARLRALRLAKEAADKQASNQAATIKKKKQSRSS